jgi:hypothetical protein
MQTSDGKLTLKVASRSACLRLLLEVYICHCWNNFWNHLLPTFILCVVRVITLFMVTPFIALVGITSCRERGGFELIFISSLQGFTNNLIKKVICIHWMQRLGRCSHFKKKSSISFAYFTSESSAKAKDRRQSAAGPKRGVRWGRSQQLEVRGGSRRARCRRSTWKCIRRTYSDQ